MIETNVDSKRKKLVRLSRLNEHVFCFAAGKKESFAGRGGNLIGKMWMWRPCVTILTKTKILTVQILRKSQPKIFSLVVLSFRPNTNVKQGKRPNLIQFCLFSTKDTFFLAQTTTRKQRFPNSLA